MAVGRDSGIAARTCISIQFDHRVLQYAASEVIVFVKQACCFFDNGIALQIDFFIQEFAFLKSYLLIFS